MSKLLVFSEVLLALVTSPAFARPGEHQPTAASRPAAGATLDDKTLDDKTIWFRDAIDDLLTGSGPLTRDGRSESRGPQRK